ncbi:MAG: cytochrome c [Acidobacteria bacterium]|nr:cytochrome c [Acidobacteriota bacterium]
MRRHSLVLLFLLTAGAPHAYGQQAADGFTEQQRLGRQILAQACGVCHLPPARNANTYGPPLSKATGGGNDDLMRKFILEGTPRMPGFRYFLQPAEIDAVIAYVRTVPPPAPAPVAAR